MHHIPVFYHILFAFGTHKSLFFCSREVTTALYELVINGPWSVASSSLQHGNYRQDVGSETVTAAIIQNLKDRLKALYKKYGEEEALASMDSGGMSWVNENSLDV